MKARRLLGLAAAAAGLGLGLREILAKRRRLDLRGRVVLITAGSWGADRAAVRNNEIVRPEAGPDDGGPDPAPDRGHRPGAG